jgi:hypothetical protein
VPDRPTTQRGFGIYAEVTDKYGSKVTVQESSLATDDCVWIFASYSEAGNVSRADFVLRHLNDRLRDLNLDELAAHLGPSPHLNVEQAKQVRDALSEFIREHEEDR